jgi:Flp pilus assembly pilin Flp
MKHLTNFLRDDRGQDLVEYALLGAFISIVSIAVLKTLGPVVSKVYSRIQDALEQAPA